MPEIYCTMSDKIRTNRCCRHVDTRATETFTRREPRMQTPLSGDVERKHHHHINSVAGLARGKRRTPFSLSLLLARKASPKDRHVGRFWLDDKVREHIFCQCNRQILRNLRVRLSNGIGGYRRPCSQDLLEALYEREACVAAPKLCCSGSDILRGTSPQRRLATMMRKKAHQSMGTRCDERCLPRRSPGLAVFSRDIIISKEPKRVFSGAIS
ncbi:hypothetical protein FN846DRAFT_580582 [Sphaerosporella brunnea]|uniref:Uncharacterized protein n=1 Tax=Sphaerosporella brunnea TaxID=1250544 RepID=A0A5J5F1C3_9PEZI|nr:hypothetical protein FN846DRAFT_580582 [Sphaerosporella brunnea]